MPQAKPLKSGLILGDGEWFDTYVWKNPDVRLKDGTLSIGKKILIDGQQRVTALQAAIVGMEVVDTNYKKKGIRIAFSPQTESFEVCNPAIEKVLKIFMAFMGDTGQFVQTVCTN